MDFDSQFKQAMVFGFEGDFKASVAALAQLSRDYPGSLDVRYELAMTHALLGHHDECCASIRYILSVDPKHDKALQQAAYC